MVSVPATTKRLIPAGGPHILPSMFNRLLLSRFLTAAGDYAWDLAVPLVCASVFSDPLRYAALLFLLNRIGLIVLIPPVARWMDGARVRTTLRLATGIQAVAVTLAGFALTGLYETSLQTSQPDMGVEAVLFFLLLAGYIASGLGHAMMEIAIDNHWIPGLLTEAQYSAINARLRLIVLLTEASVPPVTGLWLTFAGLQMGPMIGFYGVAGFNFFTFVFEYIFLVGILNRKPEFEAVSAHRSPVAHAPPLPGMWNRWRLFARHPLALVFVASSCLWFTVLSPHSALLTVFLRVHYTLSEWTLSLFRGGAAFAGAIATFLFPVAEKRLGLTKASGVFISFQAVCLLAAAAALFYPATIPLAVCLGAIVLSRIGLYGYTLGDTQLRQRHIAEHERAGIVGMARSLHNMGTLLIYTGAAVYATPEDFPFLGLSTATAITTGAVLFVVWRVRWEKRGWKGV